MRKQNKLGAKLMSLALAAVMAVAALPLTAFAVETDGMSECHPAHDEACGYIAPVDGAPCSHLNEDGIYSCAPTDADETYTCPHDDDCGYAEAAEGAPCTHSCEICQPEENSELTMLSAGDVVINADNFPDEVFRSYVGSSSADIDINRDGVLDAGELARPVYMDVNNSGIKSLTGLTYFSNLISLNCSDTEITELDVSNNSNLTNLRCSNTAITELNLTNNKELLVVDCAFTNITGLDISNNTKLTQLFCNSTEITELDISNNPALLQLTAGNPKLTKLTTGTHSKLNSLSLDKAGITEVDLSGMPALTSLRCDESAIARLDLKNNLELNYLTCYKSGITELDVSKNTKLETLNVNDTRLTALDVSNNSALKTLLCPTTDITGLDVSNNPALTQLSCGYSKIGWINIGNNTNLSNFSKDGIFNRFDVPDDSFDITEKFPGIDVSKLTITSGATLDGNIVKDFTGTTINYTYDCGTSANGKETLNAQIYLTLLLSVTFDVNGGSGTNSTVKVYSGQKATAPATEPTKEGFHFTGWYKENGVKFNADWAIYENSTYFARFEAHTPEEDDGDCTTPILCSMCDEITTPAKTHVLSGWLSDTTNHWMKCTNENCTHTEQSAVHAPNTDDEDCTTAVTCSVCGKVTTPVRTHVLSDWQSDETNHWKTCTNAGCTYTEQSAAHAWNDGAETLPPTHTHDGVKTYSCTVCGQTKTEAVPATGHTWSTEWSKDAVNHWHKCTTDDAIKDTAAHTFGEWVIDKAATETESGRKHRDCSVCAYTETVTIPVVSHTHTPSSEWSKDIDKHWHNCIANDGERMDVAAHTWNAGEITTPATHTQDGVKTFTCTVCGQTKTEVIPKLPSNSALVDNSTGTKVEYEDGSPFDSSIVFSVTSKPQTEMDKFKDNIDKAAPGLVLGGLYDVKLLKDGAAIQPDGKVKVSIPLTDNLKAMTDLKVVYIDDNGNVTIIPSEVKDGKITFVTDHFSNYGVIGKVKATDPGNNNGGYNNGNSDSPQTGDSSPILLFVLMMGASCVALVVLGKKRKMLKHK